MSERAPRGARAASRRGIAIITVMVLLTTVLYLVLALLARSNSNFFTAGRRIENTQALQAADAAAREKMSTLIEHYWRVGDASEAVAWMQTSVNRDFPVYDARGAVAGYADVRYDIDAPHLADDGGSFGGNPYVTVTVRADGSSKSRANPLRTTRTVSISYNLASSGLPADVLSFAYFMNHWVWFTDFGLGQAQIIGNAAANGNFDVLRSTAATPSHLTVLSGPRYVYGPTGVSYDSNPYTQLYLRSQTTGYDARQYGVINASSNPQSTPRFGRIPVPRMLATIADEGGLFARQAKEQHGALQVKSVRVTGTSPLTYSVLGTTTLTSTGVYGATGSGQRENLVLNGTVSANPRVGDQIRVISVDGPVVVRGNLVMRGFIEGRGTLYAGRNIYVAGDLTYVNRPSCYPSSSTAVASAMPQPGALDDARDKVLYCAAGSVVYGDVTNAAAWRTNMAWFGYVDPQTGYRINDNHEDAGLDAIAASRAFNPADTRENDGMWTVEISNASTGEVKLADLGIVNGKAQVPDGWRVLAGSGEDADGNGRYTSAYDYARDFLFATREDASGTWQPLTFSSASFDAYPGGTYAAFCTPVKRIDGYVLANNALAGWLGDNASHVVFYGGESGRQECMALLLNGRNELIYQDTRFAERNDIGAPSAVRTAFARWSDR